MNKIIRINQNVGTRFSGEYKIEAFQGIEKKNGDVLEIPKTRRVCADWFDNIILNNGLSFYGAGMPNGGDQASFGHVGSSSIAELETDTSLKTWVASQARSLLVQDSFFYGVGSPPFYGAYRSKYRFTPGFGGGPVNLSEVGTGGTAANTFLTSRALIRDPGGAPLTISVLGNEYLDVYYTRRNYPDHIDEATGGLQDGTGTIDISGTSYGYTIRAAFVGQGSRWGQILTPFNLQAAGAAYSKAFGSDATLGVVTAGISATLSGTDGATGSRLLPYTGGTNRRTAIFSFDISQANLAGGIKGLEVNTNFGVYQILFGTVIPKVEGLIFEYYQEWHWDRKVLP